MTLKKVLIIAGGTGGHIFPALAIADALAKKGVLVEWLGAQVGMEKRLVGDQFPLHLLPIQAIRGKGVVRKLLAPWRLFHSVYLAMRLIKRLDPDLVIGLGGYASGPGGIAARLLGKPLVIHEQNAVPGLTNRVLSRFATLVFEAFPNTFSSKTGAVTVGNPVRESILMLPDIAMRFEGRGSELHVLVLGGSQGARAINQAVCQLLPKLMQEQNVKIWHQVGMHDIETVQAAYQSYPEDHYEVTAFIDEMARAYAWADIVLCRAGALTVSELAAAGVGSVLVPFPYAVDDHQTKNAKNLSDNHAAILLDEKCLSADALYKILADLSQDARKRQVMALQAREQCRPEAVAQIIERCEGLVR